MRSTRVRSLVGLVLLAVVLWRVGTAPFWSGIRSLGVGSVLAAAVLTAATTLCAAWRWQAVARGLGVDVPLRPAVAAYYRSQFLNSVLPGGVLGDVDRGVRHGRDANNLGHALRAVAWERVAGQSVQLAITVGVLLTVPSPLASATPVAVTGGVLVCLALLVGATLRRRRGTSRWRHLVDAAGDDLRTAVLAPAIWPRVLLASAGVVAGHVAVFAVATWSVGLSVGIDRLLPLALVILAAMALPLSFGGWGPREGVAAWAFAAAGLGSDAGLAVATAYGVLAIVAVLPGAVVLLGERAQRAAERARPAAPMCGAAHG
jgi:uncharacterized membrane protein YbhN (UPF0104 family)